MFIKDDKATVLINSQVTDEMGEELSYFIYGVQFLDEIKEIEVNICSGGGSVLAGYAIYSALLNARTAGKNVTCICNGVAASIAGIIFLAGNVRKIRNYGLVMIHNPSGGDKKTLSTIKESLKMILKDDFTGDLNKLMDEETWYTAQTLKSIGLVNEVIETNIELNENIKLTDKNTVNYLSEICNNILKNNIDEMNFKDYFKNKEVEKLNNIKNEASEKEEETKVEETKDAEEETSEEEKTEEEAIEVLDSRVSALEEQVAQLMEVNNKLIVENKTLKVKKEQEEKIELLNSIGITDHKQWLNVDMQTIKNVAPTIKVNKVAPVIELKNEITQEAFNSMTKEQKSEFKKTDMEAYWKFFKNT